MNNTNADLQSLAPSELENIEGGVVPLIALALVLIINSGAIGDFSYGLFCGLGGVDP